LFLIDFLTLFPPESEALFRTYDCVRFERPKQHSPVAIQDGGPVYENDFASHEAPSTAFHSTRRATYPEPNMAIIIFAPIPNSFIGTSLDRYLFTL
jgi:hypothetical protein